MTERLKKTIYLLFIHTFLISVALTCIFPLVWMINSSLKSNTEFIQDYGFRLPERLNFQNYISAFTQGNLGTYFFNSIVYTIITVIAIVLISSLAGYGISRLQFKGKNFIFYIFLAAMMIPIPGAFVPLYVLLKWVGLLNTRTGYIFAMVNVGLSLSIYLYKTFFDQLSKDLEESARIDGCGKLRIWWHVMFPLAKPATGVVVIFNALNVWNELILALVILGEGLMPLQVGLLTFSESALAMTQQTTLMAALAITALPIILIYLAMQKHIIKGVTSGATVG